MVIVDDEKDKTFLERVLSSPPAIASVVLAVLGQGIFSIYFQVVNNEQQAAQIALNAGMIKDMREQIFSMQTPLASRVLKIEDRMDNTTVVFTMRAEEIGRNIERLSDQQRRIVESLDTLYSEVSKIPPAFRKERRNQ